MTASRHFRLSLALLAAVTVTACSQWRYEYGSHMERSAVPDPSDQMSLQQALDRFGPPSHISATNNGFVMAWEHWEIDDDKLGINLGFAGADFLSADIGELYTRGEFMLLTFGGDRQLAGVTFQAWDGKDGGGQGVQPFFEFVDVTESGDLRISMPQHEWGASSLGDLPTTLNYQSGPDTGQAGLEQRGTPREIGQRTMELD